jgi:hypothetical protein
MGVQADPNVYTDPQVSVFRDAAEKAEWTRFYKKAARLQLEDGLHNFEFHSNIIAAPVIEKAIQELQEGW